MNLPHIVIPSYPGNDRITRKFRFESHIKQRIRLKELFGDEFHIVTHACTYDQKMKDIFKQHGFEAVFREERMYKWRKINEVLKLLYREKDKAILFMDDDVLPYEKTNVLLYQNTIPKIKDILRNPQSVPASCCFFHCYGPKQYLYTHHLESLYEKDEDYNRCRVSATGWAIFIKSDLNIPYEDEDVADPEYGFEYPLDDFALRAKCIAHDIPVVENHHIAFERMKDNERSTTYGNSPQGGKVTKKSVVDTRNAHWKKCLEILRAYWAKRYPNHFFYLGKTKQFRTILTHSRLGHRIKGIGRLDMILLTQKNTMEELCKKIELSKDRIDKHLYHIKTNHKDFCIRFEKGKYDIIPTK